MTQNDNIISSFWNKFCQSLPDEEKEKWIDHEVDAWSFGDSPVMADDLLSYVLTGEKTATSGMLKDYEIDSDPIPEIGNRSIILDGKGNPVCVIETTNTLLQPYNEVDKRFALAEGEGFKSLQDWRDAHWNFFTRRCKKLGITPTEIMPIVCEEFKVIFKNE